MMDAICVIPEYAKIIRSGFEIRKSPYCLIGVCNASGIAVFGNAPYTLDRRIAVDVFLDEIHIRSLVGHGNIDHLDTELLGDREMPVISGYGAQELNLIKPAPRRGTANSEYHRSCDRIIHYIEAGVSENDNVLVRDLHHIAHKLSGLVYARKLAVISAVLSFFGDKG